MNHDFHSKEVEVGNDDYCHIRQLNEFYQDGTVLCLVQCTLTENTVHTKNHCQNAENSSLLSETDFHGC